MSRDTAIRRAEAYFDNGWFVDDMARRIAIPSTSQDETGKDAVHDYLAVEMVPALETMGYACQILPNPKPGKGPLLVAERIEDPALVTVLTYGHGDTIRGLDDLWREGLSPWKLVIEGERMYGRGIADNKGQHGINIAALSFVLETRGKLGFNSRILIETSEETGSAGLPQFCETHKNGLLAADILIASDGPRLSPERPTLFMGSRGSHQINLELDLREGGHHSGNWGGILANPAIILTHALATITDARGAIRVPEWRPPLPDSVRRAVAGLEVDGGKDGPAIDEDWGEPGLTPAERVYGWNSFEILAFTAGTPERPVNAVPPTAKAFCQLRSVVGTDADDIVPALRRHLEREGFSMIKVSEGREDQFEASRLDPDDPWVVWAARSVETTTSQAPAILPNLGGSLPNHLFADVLGLKTIWVPHSYAACSQHAPNEHMLAPIAREGLRIMTGLFWDLGENGIPATR
ncbi:MAG: M20 family metallopeptidase [Rhodospirillales bacterium]|nr:M20 family metallopeptidase [Rhodospirillales bacterium]